jgi:hypothetical protein
LNLKFEKKDSESSIIRILSKRSRFEAESSSDSSSNNSNSFLRKNNNMNKAVKKAVGRWSLEEFTATTGKWLKNL